MAISVLQNYIKDDDAVYDADIKRHIQTQETLFFMVAPLHQMRTFCMSYFPFIYMS